jgi:hypothetical protein
MITEEEFEKTLDFQTWINQSVEEFGEDFGLYYEEYEVGFYAAKEKIEKLLKEKGLL